MVVKRGLRRRYDDIASTTRHEWTFPHGGYSTVRIQKEMGA